MHEDQGCDEDGNMNHQANTYIHLMWNSVHYFRSLLQSSLTLASSFIQILVIVEDLSTADAINWLVQMCILKFIL